MCSCSHKNYQQPLKLHQAPPSSCVLYPDDDEEWQDPPQQLPGEGGPVQMVKFEKWSTGYGATAMKKAFPAGMRVAVRGRINPMRGAALAALNHCWCSMRPCLSGHRVPVGIATQDQHRQSRQLFSPLPCTSSSC